MNRIHPTALIAKNVILGDNNEIGAYTVIEGPIKIGNNNIIGHHVVIGSPGQDTRNPRYDSSEAYIEIGDNNIIREFTAIQKPCYREITRLYNNIFLMQSVHIPHDAIIQDEVVITPMCVLAGISTILKGANLGMGSTVHQYSVVGQYSLVGMGSSVNSNIKPFSIYVSGKPARVNYYAVEKYGFNDKKDEIIKYVTEGIKPYSESIICITEEFEKLHIESKRPLYK